MFTIQALLALSLPVVSAWRNPLFEYKSYELQRRDETAFVFLCNCWASPGARSEVNFFSTYPTNFGSAKPEYSTIISDSSNYVWEDGGTAKDPNGGTFEWEVQNPKASTNAKAGNATDGSNKYILLRDTDSTLYKPSQGGKNYNCIVVYRAQLDSTGPTSLPPSTNATSTPANGNDGAAATTSPPVASPTTVEDQGLSTGAKAGIGVGVALGVLLLLGIAGFFFWKKRRESKSVSEPMGVYPDEKKVAPGPTGIGASPMHGHMASELHHDAVSEMPDTDPRIVEAGPGRYEAVPNSPIEMDAGNNYSSR